MVKNELWNITPGFFFIDVISYESRGVGGLPDEFTNSLFPLPHHPPKITGKRHLWKLK